jgi:hypothetical protein
MSDRKSIAEAYFTRVQEGVENCLSLEKCSGHIIAVYA